MIFTPKRGWTQFLNHLVSHPPSEHRLGWASISNNSHYKRKRRLSSPLHLTVERTASINCIERLDLSMHSGRWNALDTPSPFLTRISVFAIFKFNLPASRWWHDIGNCHHFSLYTCSLRRCIQPMLHPHRKSFWSVLCDSSTEHFARFTLKLIESVVCSRHFRFFPLSCASTRWRLHLFFIHFPCSCSY